MFSASSRSALEDTIGAESIALSQLYHKNFPQGFWSNDPVDHYAVQFRILVNGSSVAESGYLFNGNHYNSIHISGCIPVVAGKNIVEAQVRGMDMRETRTSRRGVGARDATGKRGQLYPGQISIGADDNVPLPEYKGSQFTKSDIIEFRDSIVDHGFGFVKVDQPGSSSLGEVEPIDQGIACDIFDRLLMVQFRKK